jgi:hypothetical protein
MLEEMILAFMEEKRRRRGYALFFIAEEKLIQF